MAANFAQPFRIQLAGDLRPPEVQAAEECRYRSSDHDVVEMRHDEISVGDVDVDGYRRQEQSRQSAGREQSDETQRVKHRRLEADLTSVERSGPVENLDRRRHRDDEGQERKDQACVWRLTGDEHVMAPDEEADPGDRDHRIDHEVVAEYPPTREAGNDFGNDSHRGQHHDVDGRDASRTRTGAGTGSDRRHCAGSKIGRPSHRSAITSISEMASTGVASTIMIEVGIYRPDEQRQPEPGHARRAQHVRRGDEIHAGGDAGKPGDEHALPRRQTHGCWRTWSSTGV